MSLLYRVSSNETFSPERGRSPISSHRDRDRSLSFNPFPSYITENTQAPAAFEASTARRIVQLATAVVYCLFAAGIVFGYAALKPVLIREHVYRNLCTKEELEEGVRTCFQQEMHLNLMFTTAAVGTNVAALPIGAILDRYGPRVCGIIGSFLLALGALSLAFAAELPFDAYLPGYTLLALGGPFIFIASFQLSNTFPRHSGLILALLTGAFDTSSAVFLIYRIIYQATSYTLTPKYFFLIYLAIPTLVFVAQLTIMPSQSYKSVSELVNQANNDDAIADDQVDEHTALLRNDRLQRRASVLSDIAAFNAKQTKEEERKKQISGVSGVLQGKSITQQILSPWFILITLFTIIQMTRINYFVATIRPQYEYLFNSYEKAVEVNTFFDLALPLGGIISIPFIGMILDNTSTLFVLTTLVFTATTIGILGVLPYTWAAYTNISLFVLYRPFYYTAVSDYSAKVFGFRNFGTVYGLTICLAGLGNFSQSGLDMLLHKVFGGDPRPVNLGLTAAAALVGVALVGFVGLEGYKRRRGSLEAEAEGASEVVMPGAESPRRL